MKAIVDINFIAHKKKNTESIINKQRPSVINFLDRENINAMTTIIKYI